jgi:hypothetical protein
MRLLPMLTAPSVVEAFVGGLLVLDGRAYSTVTGLLLVVPAGNCLRLPGQHDHCPAIGGFLCWRRHHRTGK